MLLKLAGIELYICLFGIHFLLTGILSGELRKKRAIIFFIIMAIPCSVLFLLPDSLAEPIAFIVGYPLLYIIPLLTVRNLAKSQILFLSLFYVGISNALITSCVWIISAFGFPYVAWTVVNISVQLILLAICILVAKGVLFVRVLHQLFFIRGHQKALLLSVIWFSAFMAFLLSELFFEYPDAKNLLAIQVLCALLIILVGIICPLWIAGSITSLYHQRRSSDAEKQIDSQIRQYELLNQANDDIRQFRHDFKNLRISLAECLHSDNIPGALTHLNKFGQPFSLDVISFDTGNPVADALLSEKRNVAKKFNTELTFKGSIPPDGITHIDLCVILGNCLDNALEACAEITEIHRKRWVSVYAFAENGFLFLTVKNPVKGEVIISGNTVSTTKADKKRHGFGLQSIRAAVREYDGTSELICENGVFTAKVEVTLK